VNRLPLFYSGPNRVALAALACTALAGCTGPGPDSGPGIAGGPARVIERERVQMGTRFHVQLVADDEKRANDAIEAAFAEVERVEALLSEWRETSEITEVNRTAGGPAVTVGPDLYSVVARSRHFSELTEGAFDISFAGCGRLWSFREPRIPDQERLRLCLETVDYREIELDAGLSTIRLRSPETRIGIAGIGKGYGVDRAAEVLESHGFENYVVDGGGDLRVLGRRIDRSWTVGVAHPREAGGLLGRLAIDRGSIVTSGGYQRSFQRAGVTYHHILDPATGMPARRSIAVTVIAANATYADALATGLFVMGPERGLELVERLPGVEALIIGPGMATHRSSGFPPLER